MAIWVQLMTVFKQVSQMFSIFKVVPPKLTALAQAVSNLYFYQSTRDFFLFVTS